MTNTTEPLVVRRQGRVGRVTLNRPGFLNALDLRMIDGIAEALSDWQSDASVEAVVIDGLGRAFCAGGDIRAVRSGIMRNDHAAVDQFFQREYALNQAIADFPKPYIALVHGACMGGGIGISVHGMSRIAALDAQFAMPEAAIGFFPDIGASFFLPRLQGAVGMWMGLTGARLTGPDAAFAGLATHVVSPYRLAELADELAQDGVAVLAALPAPPPSSVEADFADITRVFSLDTLPDIVSALRREPGDWALVALDRMAGCSPSALQWSFELLKAGSNRTLQECLAAELELAHHATRHPDFIEGVRAMLVDKDRSPRWSPTTLTDLFSL